MNKWDILIVVVGVVIGCIIYDIGYINGFKKGGDYVMDKVREWMR